MANIKNTKFLDELEETIDSMLVEETSEVWGQLTEDQKKNVEISLQQLKEGKVKDHIEVRQLANTWLKKIWTDLAIERYRQVVNF